MTRSTLDDGQIWLIFNFSLYCYVCVCVCAKTIIVTVSPAAITDACCSVRRSSFCFNRSTFCNKAGNLKQAIVRRTSNHPEITKPVYMIPAYSITVKLISTAWFFMILVFACRLRTTNKKDKGIKKKRFDRSWRRRRFRLFFRWGCYATGVRRPCAPPNKNRSPVMMSNVFRSIHQVTRAWRVITKLFSGSYYYYYCYW